MKEQYTLRKAIESDTSFLAEVILGAEMSGTDRAGLARLFDLSLEQARHLVVAMLNEEIEGCEFSRDSFIVACSQEGPVAAIAGWVEGAVDGTPSGLLKSNLIGFTFPAENIRTAAARREVLKGIQIEREMGTLQFDFLFVDPAHRGHGLAGRLFREHFARTRTDFPDVVKCHLQVFGDNEPAIELYVRLGFRTVATYRATHPEAIHYLPSTEKLVMEIPLHP